MIMEQIVSISNHSEGSGWDSVSGYAIVTTKQVIKLLIDDTQSCCEDFGYFMSEDDLDEFVGAGLLGLKVTDTELREGMLESHDIDISCKYFEGGVMFVDIETTKGVLQFVAYNDHNGYYGHEAKVVSEQLNHEEYL